MLMRFMLRQHVFTHLLCAFPTSACTDRFHHLNTIGINTHFDSGARLLIPAASIDSNDSVGWSMKIEPFSHLMYSLSSSLVSRFVSVV